jgi:hypothetical protein
MRKFFLLLFTILFSHSIIGSASAADIALFNADFPILKEIGKDCDNKNNYMECPYKHPKFARLSAKGQELISYSILLLQKQKSGQITEDIAKKMANAKALELYTDQAAAQPRQPTPQGSHDEEACKLAFYSALGQPSMGGFAGGVSNAGQAYSNCLRGLPNVTVTAPPPQQQPSPIQQYSYILNGRQVTCTQTGTIINCQ